MSLAFAWLAYMALSRAFARRFRIVSRSPSYYTAQLERLERRQFRLTTESRKDIYGLFSHRNSQFPKQHPSRPPRSCLGQCSFSALPLASTTPHVPHPNIYPAFEQTLLGVTKILLLQGNIVGTFYVDFRKNVKRNANRYV